MTNYYTNYELEYEQQFENDIEITENVREKINWLREIFLTDIFWVRNEESSVFKFYLFCSTNKIQTYRYPQYSKSNYIQALAYMTKEEYLMFSLSGIEHSAKFYAELTNSEYLANIGK